MADTPKSNLLNWAWPIDARIQSYQDAQQVHSLSMQLTHQVAMNALLSERVDLIVAETEELTRHYGQRVHLLQQERAKLLQHILMMLKLIEENGLEDQLKGQINYASLCDENGMPF